MLVDSAHLALFLVGTQKQVSRYCKHGGRTVWNKKNFKQNLSNTGEVLSVMESSLDVFVSLWRGICIGGYWHWYCNVLQILLTISSNSEDFIWILDYLTYNTNVFSLQQNVVYCIICNSTTIVMSYNCTIYSIQTSMSFSIGIYNPITFLMDKKVLKKAPKMAIATHVHYDHVGGHR